MLMELAEFILVLGLTITLILITAIAARGLNRKLHWYKDEDGRWLPKNSREEF